MVAPTKQTVARPGAMGYGAAFDDRLYRLATRYQQVTIESAPPEAPRIDTASNPEEIVEEHGRVFARSSFEGGEGLDRAHTQKAAPDRFWDSRGLSIDPSSPGELPEVTLAHATERIRSSIAWTIRLVHDTSSVWMTDSKTTQRTDDPLADAPAFVADDPHAGETATTVEDLAALGDIIFAALGANGVHKRDPSTGAWSHYSNIVATRVWVAQGRLIISDGASLYELTDAAPNPAATNTLNSGHVWTDVADAGVAVLAAADDGYVYAFTDSGGTLALAGQTEFPGERPTALAATQGKVAIGSRQGDLGRLWVGTVSEQSYTIGDRQLVREWKGDLVARVPSSIAADRTSFYAAVAVGFRVDIWRYELRTSALSRHLELQVAEDLGIVNTGPTQGIFAFEGVVFAAVGGDGLWREDDDAYVSEGYLIGPLGDFYSASPKSWVGARLDSGDPNGGAVELYYTTVPEALGDPDHDRWFRAASRAAGASNEEVPLQGISSRWIAGMVKLSSGDNVRTPSFRAFGFRAFASAGQGDLIITLPIDVGDQLERKGRHRTRIKGLGDDTYRSLRGFEGRPALVELFRPSELVRGLVESVGTPVQVVNGRGSVTYVSQVKVRGRRTTATGEVSGATFGNFTFGSQRFGGA